MLFDPSLVCAPVFCRQAEGEAPAAFPAAPLVVVLVSSGRAAVTAGGAPALLAAGGLLLAANAAVETAPAGACHLLAAGFSGMAAETLAKALDGPLVSDCSVCPLAAQLLGELAAPGGRGGFAGAPPSIAAGAGAQPCALAGAAGAGAPHALEEDDALLPSPHALEEAVASLPSPYASAEVCALCCRILCALAEADTAAPRFSPLVADAVLAIRQNYAGLYGVEELSGQLGVSKSHLVRVFSAEVGMGPGQYLTAVRIDAAKTLLARRDYPLEVVATLCGFSGANYLCKVFKKHTGLTPAAFRAQNAGAAHGGAVSEWEQSLYT